MNQDELQGGWNGFPEVEDYEDQFDQYPQQFNSENKQVDTQYPSEYSSIESESHPYQNIQASQYYNQVDNNNGQDCQYDQNNLLLQSVSQININDLIQIKQAQSLAAKATKSRNEKIQHIIKYERQKMQKKLNRLLQNKLSQDISQHKYNIIYYLLIKNNEEIFYNYILVQYVEQRVKWSDKLDISKDEISNTLLKQLKNRMQQNNMKEIFSKDSYDYFMNPNYQKIDFIQITTNLMKIAFQIQSEIFWVQCFKGYSESDLNEILEIIQNLLSNMCKLREKKNGSKRQINFTKHTFCELVKNAKTEIENFINRAINHPQDCIPNNTKIDEILKILQELKVEVQQTI